MLGACEVEDVLDEMTQTPRFLLDDLQRAAALVLRSYSSEEQCLAEKPDLCERRPQLVRHAGHEIRPQARQVVLAAKLLNRDGQEPGGQREQSDEKRADVSGGARR